jgi:hypothetical protein
MAMAASTAMMMITINNSTSVNPRRLPTQEFHSILRSDSTKQENGQITRRN